MPCKTELVEARCLILSNYAGAALGVEGFGDDEAAGALDDMPTFTLTSAAGRVFRFVVEEGFPQLQVSSF